MCHIQLLVTESVWKDESIILCTKVALMRFAVNIHTHLETLCLMKSVVWLPISYLLNSYLTVCSGSNFLNEREGLREKTRQRESDTKSLRAWLHWLTGRRACSGNFHLPRLFLSSLCLPVRNPGRLPDHDTDSQRTERAPFLESSFPYFKWNVSLIMIPQRLVRLFDISIQPGRCFVIVTVHHETYTVVLTGLTEDPYLGASDGDVVLVREDSDGDAPAVQHQHSPAQVHVGKGKDTQVQRGRSRQEMSEKTREGGLHAVRQGAETGTGKQEKKTN